MTTVEELRNQLVEEGLTLREASSIVGKANLMNKLEELQVDKESKEVLNEAIVSADENNATTKQDRSATEEILAELETPSMSDPDWSDYVLSHLRDDEKIKGHPKADSLRRLTELLLGEVVDIDTDVIQCPTNENNGRATVKVSIQVKTYHGQLHRASGVADVYPGNTEQLFAKFPVATAETRAEGRAYRKLLRLQNVVAAEEIVDESQIFDPDDKTSSAQFTMINTTCARLNMNVEKFLKEIYGIETKDLAKASKSKAQEICKTISSYQGTGVPEELMGFNSNWRD